MADEAPFAAGQAPNAADQAQAERLAQLVEHNQVGLPFTASPQLARAALRRRPRSPPPTAITGSPVAFRIR